MTSDAALVLRARGNDESAWDELLRRHIDLIRLKASFYFLPGGEDADLVQEGRVGLFKAVRDYRADQGTSFRNFAELCIRRQIITAVKTATRNKHTPLNAFVGLAQRPRNMRDSSEATYADVIPGPGHHDPIERLIAEDEFESFQRSLKTRCTDLEREVAKGLFEGESYEVIAGRLGVSVKTVDNALQRAKRKLKTAVDYPGVAA